MKILFIGDIVGNPGRKAVTEYLKQVNKPPENTYDFIVVNAENAAGGKGLTFDIVDRLLASGVSAITTGNHVWAQKEILDFIDTTPQLIRPWSRFHNSRICRWKCKTWRNQSRWSNFHE